MNQIRVTAAYTYTAAGERTVRVNRGTWPVGDGHGAVPEAVAEHGVAEGYALDFSESAIPEASDLKEKGAKKRKGR